MGIAAHGGRVMHDFRLNQDGHIIATSWEQAPDLAGAIGIVREKHGNDDREIGDGPKLQRRCRPRPYPHPDFGADRKRVGQHH